jgi:hypothetical protein
MSTERTSGRPRRFSRRELLIMGAAGTSALAFGGYATGAFGQTTEQSSTTYRGRKIVVAKDNGRPELYVDGEHVVTVRNNGSYRSATYAFDWNPSLEVLAKRMIDNEAALSAPGFFVRGR